MSSCRGRLAHVDAPVAEGHYARKQLFCSSPLISWSHTRRYATGLDLASRFAGKTILDYGAGDGTFLALLLRDEQRPERAIGAEISAEITNENAQRLGGVDGVEFIVSGELNDPAWTGAFDGIVCMEVLEHVVDPAAVLDLFARLLKPGGELLVSVPVEIGLSVLLKQTARRLAGWMGNASYAGTSSYSWPELAACVFAGQRQHIARPTYGAEAGAPWHDHKGFNWKVLRGLLAERLEIERQVTSPVRWLPPVVASQVWFVARWRGAGASMC